MTLFLSYSHEDQAFADRFGTALTANYVKVWKDSWKLSPGDDLTQEILEAIEGSSFFCPVLSPRSVRSPWVRRELEVALRHRSAKHDGFLLPLLIEDCEVPAEIEETLALDFRHGFEQGLRRLLERVGRKYNTAHSGRLEDGRDYFFHWGTRVVEVKGTRTFELDLVAYDLEVDRSVLVQLRVRAALRSPGDSEGQQPPLTVLEHLEYVLETYPEEQHWIKLQADQVWEGVLFARSTEDPFHPVVSVRMWRLGAVPDNTQLFPLRAYLKQTLLDSTPKRRS